MEKLKGRKKERKEKKIIGRQMKQGNTKQKKFAPFDCNNLA
jgi:hypothetical protein